MWIKFTYRKRLFSWQLLHTSNIVFKNVPPLWLLVPMLRHPGDGPAGKAQKYSSWPPYFSAHNFFSANILNNLSAAYLLFVWMTHSFHESLSNGRMCLYSRTMLNDKQTEHTFSPHILLRNVVLFSLTRSLSTEANHISFTNFCSINSLNQLRCVVIKTRYDWKQVVVPNTDVHFA